MRPSIPRSPMRSLRLHPRLLFRLFARIVHFAPTHSLVDRILFRSSAGHQTDGTSASPAQRSMARPFVEEKRIASLVALELPCILRRLDRSACEGENLIPGPLFAA